jgi:hypothetical protein
MSRLEQIFAHGLAHDSQTHEADFLHVGIPPILDLNLR